MNGDLDRLLERIKQKQAALGAALRAERGTRAASASAASAAHAPGARVFDPVTGLEGEVLSGTTQNLVIRPPER